MTGAWAALGIALAGLVIVALATAQIPARRQEDR